MPKAKKKTSPLKKKTLKKKTVVKSKKKITPKKTVKRKAKKVLAIPKGYNSITPYLIVNDAAKAIAFYKKIFGAKEVMRMEKASGKIGHAELKIGDTKIMLADECPESRTQSPEKLGGSCIGIHLYIKNVDDVVEQAISEGATLERPVENMFYGDRSGSLIDPFGHTWYVSTHIEDVTPAKIKKRATEMYANNV